MLRGYQTGLETCARPKKAALQPVILQTHPVVHAAAEASIFDGVGAIIEAVVRGVVQAVMRGVVEAVLEAVVQAIHAPIYVGLTVHTSVHSVPVHPKIHSTINTTISSHHRARVKGSQILKDGRKLRWIGGGQ